MSSRPSSAPSSGESSVPAPARRGRGSHVGLTRDDVVSAAAEVAEEVRLDGMTIRAVAKALDITPMGIYNHVANIDELRDAVADYFVSRVLDRLPEADSPLDDVRQLTLALHRAGVEHPGLLLAVTGHIPAGAPSAAVDFTDRMLTNLISAGATQQQAYDTYHAVLCLCLGAATAATNLRSEQPVPLTERIRRQQEHYGDAPVAAYLDQAHSMEQFLGRQLDLLLGGLSES